MRYVMSNAPLLSIATDFGVPLRIPHFSGILNSFLYCNILTAIKITRKDGCEENY